VKKFFRTVLNMLRYDTTPVLNDTCQLIDFIEKQSSFVSQVTLYTYIKTRAGTQHPKLFENDQFLTSLKIARWHIFAACVADLSVFAAARFYHDGLCAEKQAARMAGHFMSVILSGVTQDDVPQQIFTTAIETGKRRAAKTDFSLAAADDHAFQSSAQALLDWAPVVDEFKKNDELIVRNSIHLRWIGVRRDVIGGLNTKAVLASWHEYEKPKTRKA